MLRFRTWIPPRSFSDACGDSQKPMNPDLPAVDVALGDVRELLHDAGVPFKLVDGLAVVHHGYARTTEDIDVLIERPLDVRRRPSLLASHGFKEVSPTRLEHASTAVRIDLLLAGSPLPRAGAGRYPSPSDLAPSPRDRDIVGLAGLLELKLRARRHRDEADVVELLKRLDEGKCLEVEASVGREQRPRLAELRRDAIEEMGGE
jgi:hypothetical protein